VELIPISGGAAKTVPELRSTTNTFSYLIDNVTPGTYDVTFSTLQGLTQLVRGVVVTSGNSGTADVVLANGVMSAGSPTNSSSPAAAVPSKSAAVLAKKSD
jgi:hypothetical protein